MSTETRPSRRLSGSLQAGDLVLLIDKKDRRYLARLDPERSFHSHGGVLPHAQIIGKPEGSVARTAGGMDFRVVRPTLAEYALKMRRGATIIYPKDMGAILVYADIYPGARVVEAGAGSGALSLLLLRAVGEEGRVISYEVREDFAARALENVRAYDAPALDRWTLRIGNIYEGIEEREMDRVVLDLPEPWQAIPPATQALREGGIILAFVPTTLQVHQFVLALEASGAFGMVQSIEVLVRPWDVSAQSVRPAHRMVAHTGFIITARRMPQASPAQGLAGD